MGRARLGIITGMILGRVGVEISPHPFHRFGDLLGTAPLGPFKHQVLDKVRDSAEGLAFMPRPYRSPDPDRGALHMGHPDGGDANPVLKFGDLIT